MEQFASQDPRSYSLYFDLKIDFGPEKLPGLSRNGPQWSGLFGRLCKPACKPWGDLGVGRWSRGHPFCFEILYYFYRLPSQKNKKCLLQNRAVKCPGHPFLSFLGPPLQTVRKKCAVQTPSDLNYCMYIFYKHYLNFETKMIFLCILIVWSHEEIIFICANVSCSYDATAAKSPYYFK